MSNQNQRIIKFRVWDFGQKNFNLAEIIAEQIWKTTPPPEAWKMNSGDWFDWLKKEINIAIENYEQKY